MSKIKLTKIITFLFLLLIAFSFSYGKYKISDDNSLHIKVYDIGQGDSIFIKAPEDFYMLIDGGPDSKALSLLIKDLPPGPCNLDVVVLTHPHADHLSGLNNVIKYCLVDLVLTTNYKIDTKTFSLWEKNLNEGTRSGRIKSIRQVNPKDSFAFGNLKFEVLWPNESYFDTKKVKNPNYASIVLYLNYGSFDTLLTGDAESEIYDGISFDKQVELLKVSHHGSIDAFNARFLSKIKPEVSIVSVGKDNKYRHPSIKTIFFLKEIGSQVYRTDESGTVEVTSDGKGFEVKTER